VTVADLLPEFVAEMPDDLQEGLLYISVPFRTSVHLCACGCRGEVWMPIRPDRHHLTWDGDRITMAPSVGNWGLHCKSHYWIRNSQVVWVPDFAPVDNGQGRLCWLARQIHRLGGLVRSAPWARQRTGPDGRC
jgi:hypothetical protein